MSWRHEGWPRSAETQILSVLYWAVLFCLYAQFLRWLLNRNPPRFSVAANKQGTTRKDFNKFAAQCIVAITTHVFLGPLAVHTAIVYQYYLPLGASLYPCISPFESYACEIGVRTCRIGEVFTANMIYQLLFWFLGWEKGLDSLAHHVGFLIAGCLVLVFVVYGKLAMFAVAMELSSPFLNLYLLARMLDGKLLALVSNVAMVVFTILFLFMRLGCYSFAVFEFHYLYWFRRELFPLWTPLAATYGIMITFTLGWVLQLFWAKVVVLKALKVIMGLVAPASKQS